MEVLMQNLQLQTATMVEEITDACKRVINSGWYVLGQEVKAFEHEFASFLGTEFCVTNANGTDALELAMKAVGVKPGDEVIVAANAGMYASVAALAAGAIPVYVDIELSSYSLDPEKLAPALTKRTKAVVLTHLYGLAGAVDQISTLCKTAGISLIEDCAECHGARVRGRALGTWGDVGCFSFYPTKNLGGLGDGGACVTSDAAVATRLQTLRQYGWISRYDCRVSGGRNSRLDEIQAAILRVKLKHVPSWNQRRREIAEYYNSAFAGLPIAVPRISSESYVAHLYVIRTEHREELRASLLTQGIASDVHFPIPDYRQPGIISNIGARPPLERTELACQTVLSLPCYPELHHDQITRVASAVNKALRKT